MYHFFEAITNKSGDALPGYQVKLFDATTGDAIPLYSDSDSTPIISESGIADTAVVDDNGNATFWVASGSYSLDIYSPGGARILRIPTVPMVDGSSILTDLEASTGAALVGATGGDTVQDGLNNRPTSATLAASGGSALVGFTDGLSATTRTAQAKLRDVVSVKDFGAVGDGATDDRVAIQAAVDAVSTVGENAGGIVFFPQGTYLVGKNPSFAYGLKIPNNVVLRGEGLGTVIKLAAAADAHLISIDTAGAIQILDLVVDGNRTAQTGAANVCGIRLDNASNVLIRNVTIKNTYHYGIGLEGGTLTDITIDNVNILDAGGDGIDMKNIDDANENIKISNVTVRRWGLDTTFTTQAAYDLRGPCLVSNVFAESDATATTAVGIRVRNGELLDANGLGGHLSQISNFTVKMNRTGTQRALVIAGRDCGISNGTIEDAGDIGINVQDYGNRFSNILVYNGTGDGIQVDEGTSPLIANKTLFSNVRSVGNGGDGWQIETDDVALENCQALSNTGYGLNIASTADSTRIGSGCLISGNTAGRINNLGANTYDASRNADGTYTPTLTNVTNISSSTAYACQYSRNGNTVMVSGKVDVTATASAATTQLALSLPIASNLASENQLAGTAVQSGSASNAGRMQGDATNDRALLLFNSDTTAARTHWFTFTYRVI